MVLKELGIKGTDAVFYHSTKRDRIVFVDLIPPGLICPVCRDVFVEPRIAPCGHSLCDACVQKVNRQTGKCFSCSAPADPADFMVDNVSSVQIGDLRVLCRHALGLREVEDDAQGGETEAEAARARAAAGETAGSSSLQPGVELYVRLDDFNETACSSAVRLSELETHEETCAYRVLMCDLCDVEEVTEENRPPGGGGGGPGVLHGQQQVLQAATAAEGGLGGAMMGTTAATGGAGALGIGGGGGVCGFTCLLRDMPHHRATCAMRVTNCVFANFGCKWRGSFTRLASHRASCRKQPRSCPNGCGAHVSVGPMMMKHLDQCPMGEVTCDAPDAEEKTREDDDDNDPPQRCPAVVRRMDLARHRREHCDWARTSRCRQCRVLVSLRSAGEHAAKRCVSAREPCPKGCGRLVTKEGLQRHLDEDCEKVPVDCPYRALGCTARTERGKMNGHVQHAAGQHLELIRKGLLEARRRGQEFRHAVDNHREEIITGVDARRTEASAALAAKESALLHDVATMRERDAEIRARAAGDTEVLKQAMADQTSTYSAQMLDMFGDLKELRREFEAFKRRTEEEMRALRATVESNKSKAEELFHEVRTQRGEAVGRYREEVTQCLADEEKQWHMDVDKQTRALRSEFDDYKFGVNAKLLELWDSVKTVGRQFA